MGRKPDSELTDEELMRRLFPREVREQLDELVGDDQEQEDEEESDTEG
jgi:hypothetical protein